jgi:hypothetical protein
VGVERRALLTEQRVAPGGISLDFQMRVPHSFRDDSFTL